jgi:D-alanyl-D-alanine carboxypeptidase/D-alanyl-D-alanine-endopeptidase (penicillin-binding protein 4)
MIEVNGKIGQKADTQSLGMPCDRPALYAACVFRSRLHSEGVQVMGDLRLVSARNAVPPPTSKNTIAMYPSPPLSEIVKTMMKHSDNHFAEQLYCAVSAIKLKHGSYKSSFQIESDLLRRAGINPGEVRFTDGCGLSRLDRVAPSQVCKMLDFMMRSPYAQAFFDALPIGGRDGTLRNRLQAKSVREKVFAKTGFINGVSCLSGYLLLQPQKTIVFSFLVNNVPGSTGGIKTMQDKLLGILAMLSV